MSENKMTERVEPTPEQIAEHEAAMRAQKKELTAFYKAELPLLRLQAEYEECLSRIEVSKMQRIEIMMAKAQMMQGPEEDPRGHTKNDEHMKPVNESVEDTVEQPKERKLKIVKD